VRGRPTPSDIRSVDRRNWASYGVAPGQRPSRPSRAIPGAPAPGCGRCRHRPRGCTEVVYDAGRRVWSHWSDRYCRSPRSETRGVAGSTTESLRVVTTRTTPNKSADSNWSLTYGLCLVHVLCLCPVFSRLPDTSATRHFGIKTLWHRSQDTSTPKTWYETLRHECRDREKAETLQPRTIPMRHRSTGDSS